jgi:hypothetical protein
MDEIRLPQHVVDRLERRWKARFGVSTPVLEPPPASALRPGNARDTRSHSPARRPRARRRNAKTNSRSSVASEAPSLGGCGSHRCSQSKHGDEQCHLLHVVSFRDTRMATVVGELSCPPATSLSDS